MNEQEFERAFNGSPVRRAQFNGLRRNVAIAMGNAIAEGNSDGRDVERLRDWATSDDEGLRTAARWALSQLEIRGSTAGNR